MIRRFLREPMLHFAFLGAALFVAYRWLAPPVADQSIIVVTADRIASLQARFGAQHGGRPPTATELQGLIEAYARDEMLYREGIALGLDRDDPVVRNRVRQKVDLLSAAALAAEPTDADLQAYLDKHRSEFDLPGRLSFEQVYFDPNRHAGLDRVITDAHEALRRGLPPHSLGDPTMLPSSLTAAMPNDISAQFGPEFAAALAKLGDEGWQGPVKSSFGLHLVRITSREPATRATLGIARGAVTREWQYAQMESSKAVFYRGLARRYQVQVETTSAAIQAPAKAASR